MKKIILIISTLSLIGTGYGQIEPGGYPYSMNLTAATITVMMYAQWRAMNPENNVMNKSYKEGMLRDRAQMIMGEALSYYDRQRNYPAVVSDGWHIVVAMNNYDYCEPAKVLVVNDSVVQYVIDDWQTKEIIGPAPIENCRAFIRLVNEKSQRKKNKKSQPLDLYFLDFIENPNSTASPPVPPGKACFWAVGVRGGEIKVFINNILQGDFYPGYPEGLPECGQEGTLTIDYKSGIYNFKAMNEKNVWRGIIEIFPGECTLQLLSENNTTKAGFSE